VYFIENENELTLVSDELLRNCPVYTNSLYEENFARLLDETAMSDAEDNFRYINRISFQLSNLCNFALIHKLCPLNIQKEKIIMPAIVVDKVLNELKGKNYKGLIGFHVYNEPMIDPRLFLFIKDTKNLLPNSKILILTNGYYLNRVMFKELREVGVDVLHVSAYSKREYLRLISLDDNSIAYSVLPSILDDRISQYERPEKNLKWTCQAPLNEVCIAPTGQIFLCCLDWKLQHTFGSLIEKSFNELINSDQVTNTYNNLTQGNRCLDLCKRCDWIR